MLQDTKLSKPKINDCKRLVENFLKYDDDFMPTYDLQKTLVCLNLLKKEINIQKQLNGDQQKVFQTQKVQIDDLKQEVKTKDHEISILSNIIRKNIVMYNA